jgi:hypothetical protein
MKQHNTEKNAFFWNMTPCGSHVSEGLLASIIRVKGISELGTALAVTNN